VSGPVWHFERGVRAACDVCLRESEGLYVEGSMSDNSLRPRRRVCQTCYDRSHDLIVAGEVGERSVSPAYVGQRCGRNAASA
jgi:hypothetical protein